MATPSSGHGTHSRFLMSDLTTDCRRQAIPQLRMINPFKLYGIIFERHGVMIFEQWTHKLVGTWIHRRLHKKLTTLRRLAYLPILDHNLAAFDHIPRMPEHPLHVVVVLVDHDICIATNPQVS